jgi:hypothetical protein
MVLLAASFYIENALQASTPAWFSLTPGSVAEWLIVAVAVLANALFFEWLYSRAADRQKVCPACKAEVSADAAYCLDCGLEQPPAPPRKWEAFKRFYSGRKRPSAK